MANNNENNSKKYVSLDKLSTFLDNLKEAFSSEGHRHDIEDIDGYTIDTSLSSSSNNPVANSVIDAEFDAVSQALSVLEQALDSHNHDDTYAEVGHIHDEYADVNHNHDSDYADINHNHDEDYADIDHNHDDVYLTEEHIANLATEEYVGTAIDTAIADLVTEDYVSDAIGDAVEGLATEDYVDDAVADLVNAAPTLLNTLDELAAALGDDPDFATTIATQIGEISESIPTKVSDLENDKGYLTEHQSLDGYVTETELNNKKYLSEVAPKDVIFDYDLIITQPIGRITQSVINDNNGAVTLDTKTKSLEVVFSDLFGGELQPSITFPSCDFYTSGNKEGEVGEIFDLPTATFKVTSVGSYSYNPTGIKFSGSITGGDNTETFTDLVTNNKKTVTMTGANTYTDSPITFKFSGQYSYNKGNTPKTNLDKDSTEVSAIEAVTNKIISASCTYSGYRKIFAGSLSDGTTSFESSDIRGLGNAVYAYEAGNTIKFYAKAGTKRVVVAIPSTYANPKVSFKYQSPFNANELDDIALGDIKTYTNASVVDASGANAIGYYVYAYENAVAFDEDTRFEIAVE